jgi:hypothetical protein
LKSKEFTERNFDYPGTDSADLEAGPWSVSVRAYSDMEKTNVMGTGEASVTITTGETVSITVEITATGSTANGDLAYNISYPGRDTDYTNRTIAIFLLESTVPSRTVDGNGIFDAKTETTTIAGTLTFDPGYYRIEVQLQRGGSMMGKTEVAHIYGSLTTVLNYSFTNDDFLLNP